MPPRKSTPYRAAVASKVEARWGEHSVNAPVRMTYLSGNELAALGITAMYTSFCCQFR